MSSRFRKSKRPKVVYRNGKRALSSIFGDWATWLVRALIPAIAYLAYQGYVQLQQMNVSVAVLSAKVDVHSQQLDAIWRRLPPKQPGN